MADNLLQLAERCEAATGPDRELDMRIKAAVYAPPGAIVEQSAINGAWCIYYGEYRNGGGPLPFDRPWAVSIDSWRADAYTASIDAAMTLVPEGCGWLAGWGQISPNEPMGGARVTRNARFVGHDANYDALAEAEAATPALALTAAALRALASTPPAQHHEGER